jgi:Tfp pilus assembly protein PilF
LGDAAPAPKHGRKKLPPVARQTPDERESEDLRVAEFYQNDKNYKAAYLRATDAVSLAASDPDAHFALAEAARRLGKLDEAETHYKKCLSLDPLPKERRESEKALKEMSGG